MKTLLLILFVFVYASAASEDVDTLYLTMDMKKYTNVAKQKLCELVTKEISLKNTAGSSMLISDRYSSGELETLSIPVFELSRQAKFCKCGDNIELLIAFRNDPYFQNVMLAKDKKQVGGFDVLDSFNESNRIKDSIQGDNPFHLHSSPILYDNGRTDEKILKYVTKNVNVIVFMIKGVPGFWVIKHGTLFKLNGLKEVPANIYFTNQYGEDYVHDISNDAFRTGYPYVSCGKFKNKAFKKIFIKIKTSMGNFN